MPHARTGVGTYTWHLTRRLPIVAPDTTFVAWYLDVRAALGLERRPRLFEDVRAPNLVDRRMPLPSRWFDRVALRLDTPRLEWMVRFDVLFAPNFVPPPTRSRRVVLTVHDLAYKLFPETAPLATRRWLSRLDASLRRASQVIVVSEQTRRDLLESYPRWGRASPSASPSCRSGWTPQIFRPRRADAVAAVRSRYAIEARTSSRSRGSSLARTSPR